MTFSATMPLLRAQLLLPLSPFARPVTITTLLEDRLATREIAAGKLTLAAVALAVISMILLVPEAQSGLFGR